MARVFTRAATREAKLTWSPNTSNTLMAQYMEDPIDIPDIFAYRGYSNRGQGADALREQGGSNVMVEWTGVLSDRAFLNIKYNQKRDFLNQLPIGSGTTYRITNSAGIYWNNATSDYRTNRNFDVLAGTWSQFVDDLAGDHNFKAGLEYFVRNNEWYDESYPGGDYIRFLSDGETPYYR